MEQHQYDAGVSGMGPCNALVERDGAGDTCGQPADDPAHHPDGGPALPFVGDRPDLELIQQVMAELGVEHPGDVLMALEKRFNALIMARQSRDEHRQARLRAEYELAQLAKQLDEVGEVRIAQAHNQDGMPLWIHLCGYVDAFTNVPLDRPPYGGGCDECDSGYPQLGDWRPLLAEASHRPPGPARRKPAKPLTLPKIPDGTIALRGNRTGRRYVPSRRHEDRWVVEDHVVQVLHSLASVLIFEDPDGVEPESAGPREALVWPQLRTSPNTVTAVQVNGERWDFAYVTTRGVRMFRRASERDTSDYTRSKSLGHLRELGEVHEIVE